MAEKVVDAEVGISDSFISPERRKQASLSPSSASSFPCQKIGWDSIKILVVCVDAREEIVVKPGDTVRTVVERFMEKRGGVVGSTKVSRVTSEEKVLDMEDSLTEAGLSTGEILNIEIKNKDKTVTNHFPWHLISFTCGLLCLITLVASITAWSYSYAPPDRYLVLLDAGSVHTSISTYRYSYSEPDTPVKVRESHYCEVGETGISSFKDDPSSSASFLSSHPCLVSSIARIPPSSRPFSSIVLGSTAGMRVLNLSTPDSTRQILDNVTKELEVVSMGMKSDARILSGEEEGVDGWVTANYLDGGLVGDEKDMIGALDWGGASSQITRMVDVGDGDRRITLYGQDYKLLTRSNLCYGQAEALNRHKAGLVYRLYKESGTLMTKVPDPCLPRGALVDTIPLTKLYSSPCTHMVDTEYMDKINKSMGNVTFTPDQNQTICLSTVMDLFTPRTCLAMFVPQPGETTCLDPSTIPPPGQMKYLAFSTYWYLTNTLGLQSNFPLAKLTDITEQLCQAHVNSTLLASLGSAANIACFQASFMTHLLTMAYHFNSSTWSQISFVKRIAKTEVGWGLGYAVAQANSLPPTEGRQYISLPLFLVLEMVSGLLLLLCVGSTVQVMFMTREYSRLQDTA